MTRPNVLAVDLGTSGVKMALVDAQLRVLASASRSYATVANEPGQAEQHPAEWLRCIEDAATETLAAAGDASVGAVSLTAQMPTLVAIDATGAPLGPAVTWQDSRADQLVQLRLSGAQRRRVAEVSGAPIDGRYVVPMHARLAAHGAPAPKRVLSAKDYLFAVLTDEAVTDPSTASGFGTFDLDAGAWSEELLQMWDVPASLLPRLMPSTYHAPLRHAEHLPGVAAGTPVVLGAADSVCAHSYVTARFGEVVSVIDGSSTVVMTGLGDRATRPRDVLVTPLVDPGRLGVELNLLATGTTIGWLAALLGVSPDALEAAALAHPDPVKNPTIVMPYFSGGEQGALWRSDVTGTLAGLTTATTSNDLAMSLFEGIVFETLRCLNHVGATGRPVVNVAAPGSRLLRPAILDALWPDPVLAITETSPSVLGAAALALASLGVDTPLAFDDSSPLPELSPHYRDAVPSRAARYLSLAPDLSAPLS